MIPPETTTKDSTQVSTPGGPSEQTAEAPAERPARDGSGHSIQIRGLNAYYGAHHAIKELDIDFAANEVTAIIGPSGSGKSTVVRCINRMHEEIPGARAEGSVMLDQTDLYGAGVDVTSVRRVIGMVFQKPNPFPTMSIYDNVAAGLRLTGTSRGGSPRAGPLDAARGRPVGRGEGSAERTGHRAIGRPAAAAVYRPDDRDRARGGADGRAVLGARPGRDAEDRGADRRARSRATRS